MPKDRLSGKRILVTGAGTGIGQGVARECASEGATVAVHYSRSTSGAEATVDAIRKSGGTAEMFQADLRDLSSVQRLADEAREFLGGVDALVNNAGITSNIPFNEVKPEQFDTLYQVNVRGPLFLTQHLREDLEKSQGSVVNMTSIHAFQGMNEHSVYAGTKGAITSSTRALAIELAPCGIRVNGIAPGCVPVDNYRRPRGYEAPEAGFPNTLSDKDLRRIHPRLDACKRRQTLAIVSKRRHSQAGMLAANRRAGRIEATAGVQKGCHPKIP